MPSVVPGFEYDVFISYRHNDNLDGWVTAFKENLEKELRAAVKEPLTIYFDKNPVDGLLETHSVDKSLERKLKSLIFIPIISQTYCDPEAFAWQHEFCAFNRMMKEDSIGGDVVLGNGNVAGRILPVRIHTLDVDDIITIEDMLGEPLRAIDFIFKSPGVNRPLQANEHHPVDNENKTYYRDQVNKVANAVKEILSAAKRSEKMVRANVNARAATSDPPSRRRLGIFVAIVVLLMVVVYLVYPRFGTTAETAEVEASIAVLSFKDQSPDGDQEWLGDGVADEILHVLARTEGLRVIGKTSSFAFKGKDFTIKQIAERLGVKTVLEGSVSKSGGKIRIVAQLIDAETEAHLWSEKYDRDEDDMFVIIDEVSQSIATNLLKKLPKADVRNIRMIHKPNPRAYEYFLKAERLHSRFFSERDLDLFLKSKQLYELALEIDPRYMDALAGLANLYETRGWVTGSIEYYRKRDSVLAEAYQIDPESPYVNYMKGQVTDDIDSSMFYLAKAYRLDPHSQGIDLMFGQLYYYGFYDLNIRLADLYLNQDPLDEYVQQLRMSSLFRLGKVEEARAMAETILTVNPGQPHTNAAMFDVAAFIDHNAASARTYHEKLLQLPPISPFDHRREAQQLALEGDTAGALALADSTDLKLYLLLGKKEEALRLFEDVVMKRDGRMYVDLASYLSLKHYPVAALIREEPKYQQWLAEAKKVHDQRVKKYYHLFE